MFIVAQFFTKDWNIWLPIKFMQELEEQLLLSQDSPLREERRQVVDV